MKIIIFFIFLLYFDNLYCQNIPLLHSGFRPKFYWISENETFHYKPNTNEFIINNVDGFIKRSVPNGILPPNYFQNTVWGIKLIISNSLIKEAYLLNSTNLTNWNIFCKIDRNNGEPWDIYPLLSKDLFLAYNPITGFHKNNKTSILSIFRLNSNKLELDEIIELDFFEKLFYKNQNNQNFTNFEYNKNYTGLFPFLDHLIRYNNGFAIVSKRSGRIWFFSETSKSIIKSIDIFSLSEKELKNDAKTEMCILDIKPMKNGSILVATRDEFAFKNSNEFFNQLITEKTTNEFQLNDVVIETERSLNSFNDIEWWEINPITGEKSKYFEIGLMNKIQDKNSFRKFNFSFDLDGNVVFNNIYNKEKTEKTNQKIHKSRN